MMEGVLLCFRCGLLCPLVKKTTTMGSHLKHVHIVLHVLWGIRGQTACAHLSVCVCVSIHLLYMLLYTFYMPASAVLDALDIVDSLLPCIVQTVL